MSSKEPTLSPRAAELKAEANNLFQTGGFNKAFDAFTAAISEESQSPALYSNRSAAAMKMKNFDQALKDAEKAVKLDPDWDKAHGRVAAAHECLNHFQAAYASYVQAASISKDVRQKGEYASAAKRIQVKIQGAVDKRMNETLYLNKDSMGVQRLEALEREGHKYSRDSAAWRHCYVSKWVKSSWEEVQKLEVFSTNRDGSPLPPGSQRIYMTSVIFDFMLDLVAHVLEDPMNGIVYPATELWNDPTSLVAALTFGCCQIPNAAPPTLTPSKTIKHFEVLQKEHGWDSINGSMGVRSLLAGAIRISILRGIIYEMLAGDYGTALQAYTRSYTLIGLARAKWPKQAGSNRAGTSLERTFWRGVGARILECRLHLSSKGGFQPKDMDQIEQLATEQIQSCQKYPLPRPEPLSHVSRFVHWLGFDTCLRGEAYMALALVHRSRAEQKEKVVGKLRYLDPTEAQRALEFYLHASSCFPGDDNNFAVAIWRALTMQIRIGGVSLAAMDSLIASAKQSEEEYDRFYGPSAHTIRDGRDEVLGTREKLAAKAKELKLDPSKAILSAIPRYDSGGKHVKLRKLINKAENNASKHDWDEGEEGTTRISIVEVMDKARQQRRRELDRTPAVYLDD